MRGGEGRGGKGREDDFKWVRCFACLCALLVRACFLFYEVTQVKLK